MAQGQQPLSRNVFQVEQWVLEHIHTFFNDLPVTLHDLRNPTSEMVTKVYGAFLEELSVNTANLRLIQNNQMKLITHVDMYNVSVPLINYHRCLSFFLESIGVKTLFSISDLVAPTSKRTLHFLETLLRFLVYCDDRIGSMQPELEKISELGSRQNELLENIEVLRSEINKRASSRSVRQDTMKNVVKTIDLESRKLEKLMNEKEAHASTQNSLKKLMEEDTAKENKLIQTLKQIVDEANTLKEMIVNSPEKLKRAFDIPTQQRNELKECERNLKDVLEAKKQLTLTISQEQIKLEERFKKMRELLKIKFDIAEEEKMKYALSEKCVQVLESYNESRMQIFKREESQKSLIETIKKYYALKETQDKKDGELLEKAKMELKGLIKQREQNIDRLNRIQSEVIQIDEDIIQLRAQFMVYKQNEGAIRAKHQLVKKYMIGKYNNIISKLRSMNENTINNK